jgi:hypothetical protein
LVRCDLDLAVFASLANDRRHTSRLGPQHGLA